MVEARRGVEVLQTSPQHPARARARTVHLVLSAFTVSKKRGSSQIEPRCIFQAKKKDGAEVSEVLNVPSAPTMADLDTGAMNADPDPDATQLVTESAGKKRTEEDITK